MSKKRVELMPINPKMPTTVDKGIITEIRDTCVIAVFDGALQLIPIYRFIKEDDKTKLSIGAKIKVNRYYTDSTRKKLLAYNVELDGIN